MIDNENNINELEEEKRTKPLDNVLDWLESFAFAIFVVILIFTFVLRTVVVKGESMSPNFHDKDRLIISHFNLTPEKGDILVMNSYGLHETIIKRCIGTEGDKIKIDYNKNSVEVNGEIISNEYLGEPMIDKATYNQEYCVSSGVYEYIVPEGMIFVMGDNRNGSSDSRSSFVGFISEEDVLGKVVFRIYPFSELGRIESFI
ncbi:MAG: signal peptidase I [Ruminococcus sp.]|nr:signal peptidase I [Ruminococcus sp.]